MASRLSTRQVAGPGASPAHWLLVLHGIYGAGRNWGAVARSLVARRPEWGTLLVDLRQHGGSRGFPAPHTVRAAADDLAGLDPPAPAEAVLGHSFGGKVALLHAAEAPHVRQVWVVDSTPDARAPAGSAWRMLEILRGQPDRFPDRETAVRALVAEGVERPVALWMTTNLEWLNDEYRWRIDLDDMEALLRDFFTTDAWDVVESLPERLALHFIRATRSSVLDEEAAARIRAAGQATGRVFLHDVEGGHWLNADNPDGLVELLARYL